MIGSSDAAFRAGQMPKKRPTPALNAKATAMEAGEMRVFQRISLDRPIAADDAKDDADACRR